MPWKECHPCLRNKVLPLSQEGHRHPHPTGNRQAHLAPGVGQRYPSQANERHDPGEVEGKGPACAINTPESTPTRGVER